MHALQASLTGKQVLKLIVHSTTTEARDTVFCVCLHLHVLHQLLCAAAL